MTVAISIRRRSIFALFAIRPGSITPLQGGQTGAFAMATTQHLDIRLISPGGLDGITSGTISRYRNPYINKIKLPTYWLSCDNQYVMGMKNIPSEQIIILLVEARIDDLGFR